MSPAIANDNIKFHLKSVKHKMQDDIIYRIKLNYLKLKTLVADILFHLIKLRFLFLMVYKPLWVGQSHYCRKPVAHSWG